MIYLLVKFSNGRATHIWTDSSRQQLFKDREQVTTRSLSQPASTRVDCNRLLKYKKLNKNCELNEPKSALCIINKNYCKGCK